MIDRVRTLWRDLSGAPEAFTRPVVVVGSNGHRCSAPGWVGVVAIRGDIVVACPSDQLDRVSGALHGADRHHLPDPRYLEELLQPEQSLGPARLLYDDMKRSPLPDVIGPLPVDDNRVIGLLRDATRRRALRKRSGRELAGVVPVGVVPRVGPGGATGSGLRLACAA